jgi:general secretion pathway protein G
MVTPVRRRRHGFTLIELMVVLAVVALLLSVAMPRYFHSVERSKETILRANLAQVRDALDKYFGDHGRYPDSLQQLVQKKYLRALPIDPVTDSASTWSVVAPERGDLGAVYDIRSSAEGQTQDGTAYHDL